MSIFMIIAIVFFVISVLLLAVTITIFFTNNIVAVIGDLTGKTAEKQIQQIRSQGVAASRSKKSNASNRNNTAFDRMLESSPNKSDNLNTPTTAKKRKASKLNPSAEVSNISGNDVVSRAKNGTVSFDSSVSGAGFTNAGSNASEAPTTSLDGTEVPTTYLSNSEAATTSLDGTEAPTTYLSNSEAPTTSLDETEAPTSYLGDTEAETTYLGDTEADTTSLGATEAETSVLSENMPLSYKGLATDSGFEVVSDETFTITDVSID